MQRLTRGGMARIILAMLVATLIMFGVLEAFDPVLGGGPKEIGVRVAACAAIIAAWTYMVYNTVR